MSHHDKPQLTDEQLKALQHNHGCIQSDSYILMSTDVYRRTMGVDSDQELHASLTAIHEGWQDAQQGNSINYREFFDTLDAQ